MDQNSFRRLLQTPRPDSAENGRGSLLSTTSRPKTIDASQPAFKPRKVKKGTEPKYRDRAAERRQGGGNDFAEVEAVLEEFKKRHADDDDKEEVDEKRKYLGGDSDHSILVKGLDIALFEANKAKAAVLSTQDDDILEKAFTGQAPAPVPELDPVLKKRTREDLIRELKEKRGQTETSKSAEEMRILEEAKKAGKFRPIGFKPIAEEKPKKKGDERKGKRRKVDGGQNDTSHLPISSEPSAPKPTLSTSRVSELEPEPKSLPDDFDIFGDVGEYEGLDLGEDEEDDTRLTREDGITVEDSSAIIPQRWIAMDEDDLPIAPPAHELTLRSSPPQHRPKSPRSSALPAPEEEGTMEDEQAARLVPLASSALPSIKDFLAMQEAAEAEEKRKKRKEKKAKANNAISNGAREPFDANDLANIILQSSDNIHFHVHSAFLSFVSPSFKDTLSLNRGPAADQNEKKDGLPIISVTEDSETLYSLHEIIYPIEESPFRDLFIFRKVYKAVQKYLMDRIEYKLKKWIVTSRLSKNEPFRVFVIAIDLHWEAEALIAARGTLHVPLETLPFVDELKDISASEFYRFLDYRFRMTGPSQPNATHDDPPARAPDPFDSSANGNAIFRSSDSVDFFVIEGLIRLVSPFFDDMFSLQEHDEIDGRPLINLSEDSEALHTLLSMIYPHIDEPAMGDYYLWRRILQAARKYEMSFIEKKLQKSVTVSSVDKDSLRVYVIATSLGWNEIARMAALNTLLSHFGT
ncbi:hypothetical protein AX15_003118 [Amanita polypyramis BW_CC]|nr:hypothetical protein AX15_003118 [Amanita polypyramis BW_CC]